MTSHETGPKDEALKAFKTALKKDKSVPAEQRDIFMEAAARQPLETLQRIPPGQLIKQLRPSVSESGTGGRGRYYRPGNVL